MRRAFTKMYPVLLLIENFDFASPPRMYVTSSPSASLAVTFITWVPKNKQINKHIKVD